MQPRSISALAASASAVASDQEPTNWTFMVALGQTLRVPVLAEGVETRSQLDILLSEAAPNGGVRAVVESFADTGARPALIAFVPGGDVHVLLTEIGRGLTSLHHLTDHLRTPGAIAGSPPPRQGRMTGLAERLEQYEDLPGPI